MERINRLQSTYWCRYDLQFFNLQHFVATESTERKAPRSNWSWPIKDDGFVSYVSSSTWSNKLRRENYFFSKFLSKERNESDPLPIVFARQTTELGRHNTYEHMRQCRFFPNETLAKNCGRSVRLASGHLKDPPRDIAWRMQNENPAMS